MENVSDIGWENFVVIYAMLKFDLFDLLYNDTMVVDWQKLIEFCAHNGYDNSQ